MRSAARISGVTMAGPAISYLPQQHQQLHHHSLQGSPEHAAPRPHMPAPNTGTWSADEDARLRHGVLKHGTRWVVVASEVGTRSGEQCAKRWNDNVNPDLNHNSWSADEDKALLALVALHGHNWKLMAQSHLQSRPPLAIKNRHALLMRRQKREASKLQQRSLHASRNHPPCNIDLIAVHPSTDTTATAATTNNSTPSQTDSSAASATFSVQDYPSTFSLSTSSPVDAQPDTMSNPEYTLDLSSMFPTAERDDQESRPRRDLSQTDLAVEQNHEQTWSGDEIDLHSLFCGSDVAMRHLGGADTGTTDHDVSGQGQTDDKGVEFSVTCSRAKLKAMVCHAFDGALMETDGMSEQTPFTVTLRLKR